MPRRPAPAAIRGGAGGRGDRSARIGDAAQGQHGGPLDVRGTVAAQAKKDLGDRFLPEGIRPRPEIEGPADRQGPDRRLVLVRQRLEVAEPVGLRQAAVKLLPERDHLAARALQVPLQPPRPLGLVGQAELQPAFIRQVLVRVPPGTPAGHIQAMSLAGQLGEGIGGGAANGRLLVGQAVEQDDRRCFPPAAPSAQRADCRTPGSPFRSSARPWSRRITSGVASVASVSAADARTVVRGPDRAESSSSQNRASPRGPERGAECHEHFDGIALAQPLADDLGRTGVLAPHEQQCRLPLTHRGLTIVKHLAQVGQVGGRPGPGRAGHEEADDQEQHTRVTHGPPPGP